MKRSVLCLTIVLLSLPSGLSQSRRVVRRSKTNSAILSEIRHVDFRNFTYPFDGHTTVSVRYGKWEKLNPEQGDFASFDITQIAFGDLTGDGKEEAFIRANGDGNYGASGWNSVFERYYIYGMSGSKPELLSVFSSDDLDRLYAPYTNECDGRVMGTKSTGIRSRVISLRAETYTPSCNVVRTVLLRVRLDAGRLVLSR